MFDVSEDFPGMIVFRLVFLWAANYDDLLLKKKKVLVITTLANNDDDL